MSFVRLMQVDEGSDLFIRADLIEAVTTTMEGVVDLSRLHERPMLTKIHTRTGTYVTPEAVQDVLYKVELAINPALVMEGVV